MTPEEQVRRKKETGQSMTRLEKILYVRFTHGLGLKEAMEELKKTGNDFDGKWREQDSHES
jgi:hypothetical protein